MFKVHGFYGHIRRNDFLSAVMFGGFLIALQLIAAVVLFLPLYLYDPEHAPALNFIGYGERYALAVLALGMLAFLVQFFLHTYSMRWTIGFEFADRAKHRRLFDIIETLAITEGLPYPKVAIINSDALNAFACGLSPSSAIVVATRGLIENLDDDELAAVMAHELAHIRNGDIRLMAAANVMLSNLQLLQRQNPFRVESWKQILLMVVFPPFLLAILVAGLINTFAMLMARLSRLLIASSREFIADAELVRMTHNPSALISALRRIDGHSEIELLAPEADAMMIDGATDGPLATHPLISERLAVLFCLSGDMAHASSYRRDTRPQHQRQTHQRTVFGRRGVVTAPATSSSSLVSRVTAGSDDNILGLPQGVGSVLAVGIIAIVTIYGHSIGGAEALFKRLDPMGLIAIVNQANSTDPGTGMRGTFSNIATSKSQPEKR